MGEVTGSDKREEAAHLIEEGDYRGALNALPDAVREDPSGTRHALLAPAHFRPVDYAAAAGPSDPALGR